MSLPFLKACKAQPQPQGSFCVGKLSIDQKTAQSCAKKKANLFKLKLAGHHLRPLLHSHLPVLHSLAVGGWVGGKRQHGAKSKDSMHREGVNAQQTKQAMK